MNSQSVTPGTANSIDAIKATFTDALHAHPNDTPEAREARALAALFPACFLPPAADESFVGRVQQLEFGINPRRGGFFFADGTLSTHDKVLAACAPQLHELLTKSAVLHVRAGWTAVVLDYDTLLLQGLQGLRVRVDARRNIAHMPRAAWDGMLTALAVLQHSAEVLSKTAAAAGHTRSAEALAAVAVHPPHSLYEALQLLLLYAAHAGFPEQHGRMDVYLGDLYVDDVRTGRLTHTEAVALLTEFLHLHGAGRITVGGRGRRNPQHADAFAAVIIDALTTIDDVHLDARLHEPTMTEENGIEAQAARARLRALSATNRATLHDDDALLPHIERDFDVALNIAERYVPVGDELYSLGHTGYYAPLCTLDARSLISNSDTFAAQALIEAAADYHALACDVTAVEAPCLLHSLLLDGCIARGETLFTGGLRFLGGAIVAYGVPASAAPLRTKLAAYARDQRERTWLHAYVCGFA
ncbi:MAG: hypothetical protein NTZ50_01635 [Chloroflexi bacterium]|nr:hypothetical protein [Chloroflexota bacterium]